MKKHFLLFSFLLMLCLYFTDCRNPAQQTSAPTSEEATSDSYAEEMPLLESTGENAEDLPQDEDVDPYPYEEEEEEEEDGDGRDY